MQSSADSPYPQPTRNGIPSRQRKPIKKISDIVTDPYLQSVLETSTRTREQTSKLLALIEDNPSSSTNPPFRDTLLHIAREQKQLHAHIAILRGKNRNALLDVRQTKALTAEKRGEVDRLHLHLQNLYYEQRHLRGEIAACEAYDHKYLSLPLLPVETYLSQHPEHTSLPEHELMIARINHEHAEREALEQARQGLLKKKQGLIAGNKKRKEDLENLDVHLEKFVDAAKPIQKMFEKEY
ncbi:MAG: hypothetical protein M1836_006961 [Candelina mexicana]|nr:MAG: hypothetical protein M1836_006961 [Candelina mexicana]